MTHLPYIVAAYALALGASAVLGIGAVIRLRRARQALALVGRSFPEGRPS
ncbi:hypothetical protein [Tanticharoenia sakaeratensis]|jgi:hypothetical protein|uniref:Heme exporter protein D n=1 Tax=Tanticharoenia sakaeratensis NBRC 103193 TaxID=1231623 RepID=A0A0D6MHV5_9PROT|nr:hypothetical protein [Tanticharoenia sakaeratensis]GAN53040.1 hypothetical protein Tasa_004_105 [Tanticharoenia sakaeratensis NBRC 103193]GBQ19700.1 hypothetical protein AA103193_1118 [Tanticharoenia sakaeratensis NBRC 103193]